MLVLDSGAVTALAADGRRLAANLSSLQRTGGWEPVVPSVVLVECLRGIQARDAVVNRFLKTCTVIEDVPITVARSAARLRALARRGSAIDALVVALAGPGGTVVTADIKDIRPLAAHAENVAVERV